MISESCCGQVMIDKVGVLAQKGSDKVGVHAQKGSEMPLCEAMKHLSYNGKPRIWSQNHI